MMESNRNLIHMALIKQEKLRPKNHGIGVSKVIALSHTKVADFTSGQQMPLTGGILQEHHYLENHHQVAMKNKFKSESESEAERRFKRKNAERRRRAEVSSAFQSLRSLIPSLKMSNRAPFRLVLEEATRYCHSLTAKEEQHRVEFVALENHHNKLRKCIAFLQHQTICRNEERPANSIIGQNLLEITASSSPTPPVSIVVQQKLKSEKEEPSDDDGENEGVDVDSISCCSEDEGNANVTLEWPSGRRRNASQSSVTSPNLKSYPAARFSKTNKERQRRTELNKAFHSLRALIPGLDMMDRVTKAAILEKASQCCKNLAYLEEVFKAEIILLMDQQKKLRKRISLLQRNS